MARPSPLELPHRGGSVGAVTPSPAPDSAAAQRQTLILGVLLLCALAFAYLPALRGEFIWDDDAHVTANPTIVGPQGLKEIWTTPAANYFPLVLTDFWMQHALWGLDPLPYHAVTLAFHMGNALLLWAVLRRLRVPAAWLGAALWALHPVQVESVAWISELKNTQSGFFFLLSVFFYAGSLEETLATRRRDYALALAAGIAAILSKPSAVMLPPALALLAWWKTGKISAREFARLVPLFAFAALAAGWAIWEQRVHQGASGAEWSQTPAERVIIAGRAIFFYLGKLIYPHPLSFIYHRWTIDARRVWEFGPALAAFAAVVFVCVRASRHRALTFAVIYFVVLLFPVLGFFNVYFFRYSYVGDHFQYLASMAPLALLGVGLARVGGLVARFGVIAIATLAVLAASALTWRETKKFSNDEALWRDTLAHDPYCWIALNALGSIEAERGNYAGALALYERAIAANPDYVEALNNLGTELSAAGRAPEAIQRLAHALQLAPDDPEVQNNLANAYRCADRPAEAIQHLEAALRTRPGFYEAHANLARVLMATHRPAEAIPHFAQAIKLRPRVADLRSDFAAALAAVGQIAEARAQADFARQLRAAEAKPAHPVPPAPPR